MKIFSGNTNINFMGHRKIAAVLSFILVFGSIAAVAVMGINFSHEFRGGVDVNLRYPQAVDVDKLRETLSDAGYKDFTVQGQGNDTDVSVKAPIDTNEEKQTLINTAAMALPLCKGDAAPGCVKVQGSDFVDAQYGKDLTETGAMSLMLALIAILFYVVFRFEYRFAVGSVSALMHDVIVTLGVFAVTQTKFDPAVLAALLAVIGYSLNDTIVVFDRIRENFRKTRRTDPAEIMNEAINQTLGRTVMTSVTTLLVLAALIVLGGATLYGFAFALIVGVVVGTYSSIFVASNAALSLGVTRDTLIPPERHDDELDAIP